MLLAENDEKRAKVFFKTIVMRGFTVFGTPGCPIRTPKRSVSTDIVTAFFKHKFGRTYAAVCHCVDYRQSRREERSPIRRMKREQERREREEIEMYRSRNDAQKFFKNVKRLTEVFPERYPAETKEVIWWQMRKGLTV